MNLHLMGESSFFLFFFSRCRPWKFLSAQACPLLPAHPKGRMVYIENLRETTGKSFEIVGEPVGDFLEKLGTLEKLGRDTFSVS